MTGLSDWMTLPTKSAGNHAYVENSTGTMHQVSVLPLLLRLLAVIGHVTDDSDKDDPSCQGADLVSIK
jgi:hypothetical protein